MHRADSLREIKRLLAERDQNRTCLTIGNFDGVHRGHRALVERVCERARQLDAVPAALTFEPHPVRFFRGEDYPPFLLTSARQRARRMQAAGIELLVELPFDAALASMTPAEFVRAIIVDGFAAHFVLVGYDFSFGQGRTGSVRDLVALGSHFDFEAADFGPVLQGGSPVSSSRVRAAVRAAEMGAASELMAAPFALDGVVVGGDARGRQIGYPTANLEVDPVQLPPPHGIYGSTLVDACGTRWAGVTSIGVRPTYYDPTQNPPVTVETYVLNAPDALDLYDQAVELELHEFVRPELAFDSTEALVEQIDADVATARRWHRLK